MRYGVSVAVGKDGPATPRPDGGSRIEDVDAPEGYENLTRIDQGGFAVVYRGRDTRFDRTVALKILRSDSLGERQLRRFRAECLAIGRVSSHPNIVTVYDAGTTGGHRPWLAMEYCSGARWHTSWPGWARCRWPRSSPSAPGSAAPSAPRTGPASCIGT